MHAEPDLSKIGALIGDPARASILSALLGGQSLPASELAYRAHITPQTASMHLAKLVEGGLLTVNQRGRHRYYALSSADVAHALEALAAIAPPPRPEARRDSPEHQQLCFARTCYDHLAGKVGVALTRQLVARGLLAAEDETFTLTEQGAQWLKYWDIDEATLRKTRRHFARACLDWSERQDHLAGALGAAVTGKLFEMGWIARRPDTRAVRLTEAGRAGLLREFGIDVTRL